MPIVGKNRGPTIFIHAFQLAIDIEVTPRNVAGDERIGGVRSRDHARYCVEPLGDLLICCGALSVGFVVGRKRKIEEQQMFRLESELDADEVAQSLHKQPRAGNQYQ